MPVKLVIIEKLWPCSTHLMDKIRSYLNQRLITLHVLVPHEQCWQIGLCFLADASIDCFWTKLWQILSDISLNKCVLLMCTDILHYCLLRIAKWYGLFWFAIMRNDVLTALSRTMWSFWPLMGLSRNVAPISNTTICVIYTGDTEEDG